MSKIRSLEELSSAIAAELSWRKKELSYLRSQVTRSTGPVQEAWVRAGLTMLYAHWEGAIKSCAEAYVQYVSESASRRLLHIEALTPNFAAMAIWADVRRSGSDGEAMCREILTRTRVARIPWQHVVDTRSNLSYEVLGNIMAQVGIPLASYVPKRQLINESLVRVRNDIAHGKRTSIGSEQYLGLHDEVISLINMFANQLENAA